MLVRAYAQATADEDENVTLLRCWSVLELVADRAIEEGQPIFHLDGQPILHRDGKQANTGSKSARVYVLTRQYGIGYPSISYGYRHADGAERRLLMGGDETHPGYTPGTRIIPLWDFTRAAYAIRNCIAHHGYFFCRHSGSRQARRSTRRRSHQQHRARPAKMGARSSASFCAKRTGHWW